MAEPRSPQAGGDAPADEAGGAHAEQAWNEARLAQPLAAPAWRLWRYQAPAVVLGAAQRRLLAELGGPADPGDPGDPARLPLLARGAGGGAVLTGPWMLGLSVALPPGHALATQQVVQSYEWLGTLLAELLQDLGIAAEALSPAAARAAPPAGELAWACFGGLSPWEVVSRGRKIAGLAQVRRRHGVLLVGGVLLTPVPWQRLCAAMRQPAAHAAPLAERTTTCAEQGLGGDALAALPHRLQQRLDDRLA